MTEFEQAVVKSLNDILVELKKIHVIIVEKK